MAVFLVKTFDLVLYGPPRTPQVLTVTWAQTRACGYNQGSLNWVFTPSTIHIHAGDTVNWVWSGGTHSTTSSDGLWDSGVQSAPYSFSHTFPQSGTFHHHCSHGHEYWYQQCHFGYCQCLHSLFSHHETGTVIVDP
jgi:hypothetical protein